MGLIAFSYMFIMHLITFTLLSSLVLFPTYPISLLLSCVFYFLGDPMHFVRVAYRNVRCYYRNMSLFLAATILKKMYIPPPAAVNCQYIYSQG